MNDKLYLYYLSNRGWVTDVAPYLRYKDFVDYIEDGLYCRNSVKPNWAAPGYDYVYGGVTLEMFMVIWYDGAIINMRNEKIEEICK